MSDDAVKPPSQDLQNKLVNLKAKAEANQAAESKAVARKKSADLAERWEKGQMTFWPEAERGLPNELARSAIFSARNKKEKRQVYLAQAPLEVPIIGSGRIVFIGEDLRQDDETLWYELVHRAREARSEWIEFVPHELLQTLKWHTSGDGYKRLLTTLRRLRSASIEVYSERFDRGISTGLLRDYQYSSKSSPKPWRVHVFNRDDNLLFLFDQWYTRIDWQRRLALPSGVATWLHTFYCSHKEPYAHKIETLAKGAGLKLDIDGSEELDAETLKKKRANRMKEVRRTIVDAHDALVRSGFLTYEIKRGLVHVTRTPDTK